MILGTSLANSILAAALARAKKNVLHLDANEYYGEHWATFDLNGLARVIAADTEQSAAFFTRLQVKGDDAWRTCLETKVRSRVLRPCFIDSSCLSFLYDHLRPAL